MNSETQRVSKWRIRIVYLVFSLVLLVVLIFLLRWQVLENDRFVTLAKQRVKDSQLASLRGSILARDGSPLAYSVPVYDVYAYMPEIEDAEELSRQTRAEFVSKVSIILVQSADDLNKTLSSGLVYIIIKREASVDMKNGLDSLMTDKDSKTKLAGLHFEPTEKRIYPDNTLACHVLGFVGKNSVGDNIGRNGIEGYWDGDLAWKKGYIMEETDSFGNQILTGEYEPIFPKVGRTIKLTIDRGLQGIAERKIEEGVKRWNAKNGTVIIMDPKTGAILAMANYPNYDPNFYSEVSDYNVYRNRAVSDPYEFGSVGKVLTASAAIDLGKVTPDTVIVEHHDGCVHLDDKEICTASKQPTVKPLTMTDVLAYSDNIGAFYTAERVGIDEMYHYFREFGIGNKTNIGLADETTSLLKEPQNWNRVDLATYSFGQGYSATALQIISALSTIPNNGYRMQPYMVSEVSDEEQKIEIKPQVASEPVSKDSALILNSMFTEVFNRNGSKKKFKELLDYNLAGKSGTASLLADNGLGYAEDKVNVTYVGWDSSEYATFIMLIKLQEPEGAPFSVDSVQPLWMETFLEIKDTLGVVPIVI